MKKVTEEVKRHRARVQALFDAMAHEKGMREAEIFQRCYGDGRAADTRLHRFLKEVATCPKPVIQFCQQMLSAQAPQPP